MRALHQLVCIGLLLAPSAAISAPKRDIKGLRPGMPLTDVASLIKANHWFCPEGPMFGPGWYCRLGGDDTLNINKHESLGVVGPVVFRFVSGGAARDIAANIEAQYAVTFKRIPQADPSRFQFVIDLGGGLVLYLSNTDVPMGSPLASGDATWQLVLQNPALDAAEEKSKSEDRLRDRPVPKF
jgi:hypothetical protein